jgi:hypothetical protein
VDKASLLAAGAGPSGHGELGNDDVALIDRGNLSALRASGGNYTGTVAACLANDLTGYRRRRRVEPRRGGATYFLVRPDRRRVLQSDPGYTTNHPREAAGRDAEIGADSNACP